MNGWYLRNINQGKIVDLSIPFLEEAGFNVSDRGFVQKCIEAVISRIDYLGQIPDRCAIFFTDNVRYDNESVIIRDSSKMIFKLFLQETSSLSDWNGDVFRQTMKSIQSQTGVKGKDLWMPFRVALTGLEHGPELPLVIEILGLDKCRQFVEKALNFKKG